MQVWGQVYLLHSTSCQAGRVWLVGLRHWRGGVPLDAIPESGLRCPGHRIEPSVVTFARVLAALLILLSPGCYVPVSEVDTVVCDRGTGTCSVVRRKVYGEQRVTFPIADLTGAELVNAGSPFVMEIWNLVRMPPTVFQHRVRIRNAP